MRHLVLGEPSHRFPARAVEPPGLCTLHRSRIGIVLIDHTDIESDDVPAEVARMVGLGATVVEEREGYTVLKDPGGLLFCVIDIQTGEHFEKDAWERRAPAISRRAC